MNKYKSLFKVTMLLLFSALALKVLLTAFFDPRAYLWLSDIKLVNHIKSHGVNGRITKTLALHNRNFDAIIAGSSRVQVGINPGLLEHYSNPYNLGLSAINMHELEILLAYVNRKQNLDAIYVGLDFLMFSKNRQTWGDFKNSPLNGISENKILSSYLLGTSIFDDLSTFRTSIRNQSNAIELKNGMLDHSKKTVNHLKLFETTLKNNFLTNRETYSNYRYDIERLDKLKNSITLIANNGTSVYLFINPIHAYQLEAIHGLGLWEVFQDWKRDLVMIVEDINKSRVQKIVLWDFSYHNFVTKEAVKGRDMKWFWESSHYKQITGELVLRRISDLENKDFGLGEKFFWFGEKINKNNIESHLQANNIGHRLYHKSNDKDVAKVMRWIKQTKHIHGQEPKKEL